MTVQDERSLISILPYSRTIIGCTAIGRDWLCVDADRIAVVKEVVAKVANVVRLFGENCNARSKKSVERAVYDYNRGWAVAIWR